MDLAALSIAPTDTAKPPKQRKPRSEHKPRVMPPGWREKVQAHGRRALAGVHARRGVTLWQKAAMVMQPGEWYLSREVWAQIPSAKGVTRSRVSRALMCMAKYGHAERRALPGLEDRSPEPVRIPTAHGGSFIARQPRWLYRITRQGLELAEEGRRRVAEGRPDCLYSGPAKVGRPRTRPEKPPKPEKPPVVAPGVGKRARKPDGRSKLFGKRNGRYVYSVARRAAGA